MKRAMKLVALVGMLTLVATACAGTKSAADACTADEFGCAVYEEGDPIRLGELLSISGPTAFLGTDSQQGVEIAIDNLDGTVDGTAGTLLGREIRVVAEDDLCSSDGGQSGGNKLAADTTIVAVIGTTCSSSALGVADGILSGKGILLFSPSNTNPNLTADGTHQPFYARTAHNDKIQGAVVADFAYTELQAKTAATIHDESPYADALAAVFRENFETLGGTITANGNQAVDSKDTDFKPLLQQIAGDKPDFLFYPNFNPACALIAKQAATVGGLKDTLMGGADGCLETSYLEQAGKAANGTYGSGPDFSGLTETNQFYKDSFLPQYRTNTGTAPTASFHAHAFDAATIIFEAIKKVAIEETGTLSIPRTALKDAVFATSAHPGVSGVITCVPLGDCATSVTIAVYKAPDWPVEGGTKNAQPVYTDTKTLADV